MEEISVPLTQSSISERVQCVDYSLKFESRPTEVSDTNYERDGRET